MRAVRLIGTLALFAAAACGDDGGSDDDDAYVEAATESLVEDDTFPFDDETAECFAERVVGAVGVENLEEAGVEPADLADEDFDFDEAGIELDEDQAAELAGGFSACDISAADVLVLSIEQDGTEVSDDLRECIEENADDDAFAEVFALAIVDPHSFDENPPEEFLSLFLQLGADCPELVEVGG